MKTVIASPDDGGLLTGVIGGRSQPRVGAAPVVGASVTGVLGGSDGKCGASDQMFFAVAVQWAAVAAVPCHFPKPPTTFGNFEVGSASDISAKGGGYLPQVMASTDVMEVFSPEHVGEICKEYGLEKGMAMDLKSGYDFDLAKDQAKCWAEIQNNERLLVIGSPSCTLFSRLQEFNKHMYSNSQTWMAKFHERMQQAKRHVKFCTDVYEYQRRKGKHFLHEHPWLATSWDLDCIKKLMSYADVRKVLTNMCQFGVTSRIGGIGSEMGPFKKPTGFELRPNCQRVAQGLPRGSQARTSCRRPRC